MTELKYRIIAHLCPIPCESHEDFIDMIVDELGPCSKQHAETVRNEWNDELPTYWDGYTVNYKVSCY